MFHDPGGGGVGRAGPPLIWRTASIIQIALSGCRAGCRWGSGTKLGTRFLSLSGELCRALSFLTAPTGQSLDLCAQDKLKSFCSLTGNSSVLGSGSGGPKELHQSWCKIVRSHWSGNCGSLHCQQLPQVQRFTDWEVFSCKTNSIYFHPECGFGTAHLYFRDGTVQ